MALADIGLIILILCIATLFILQQVGAGYITQMIFNENLTSVGIDSNAKLNLAKLAIILYWIVSVPLCIGFFAQMFSS